MKKIKSRQTNVQKGVEWHKKEIIEMTNQIEDKLFLSRIRIILKRHIQKKGD